MDYETILFDRIEIIKDMNKEFNLEENGFISFSGGKDSTVLHYLIDLALPNNHIPRVFINTGIEYNAIVEFVKQLQVYDKRIVIRNVGKNLNKTLEKIGYPFKSKQHSHNLEIFQNMGLNSTTVKKYLGLIGDKPAKYRCPKILEYQFTDSFKIKCSDKCCVELKKKPFKKYQLESKKTITLTGMRKDEGGSRNNINCVVFNKEKELVKFHPLAPLESDFIDKFILLNNIQLCELYYPPFNFKRTGCKGCPYSLDLQEQLTLMELYLPNERKQCEVIWRPIYEEYRLRKYRLKNEQHKLF